MNPLRVEKSVTTTTTTGCTSFSNSSPPEHTSRDAAECRSNKLTLAKLSATRNESASTTAAVSSTKSPPPPQIVIENASERQSWSIISTSGTVSSIKSEHTSPPPPPTPLSPSDRPSNQSACNQDDNGPDEDTTNHNAKNKTFHLHNFLNQKFKFPKSRANGLSKVNSLSASSAVVIDDDSDTIDSPTGRDHSAYESKTFLSAPKLLRSKFGSTLSIADYDDSELYEEDKGKKEKNRVQYHDPPVAGMRLLSDAERHKRKIAKARERRATLIVGLIMAAFITAWLPFFVLYVLAALCESCKQSIPDGVFAVAFWLGYCNSGNYE